MTLLVLRRFYTNSICVLHLEFSLEHALPEQGGSIYRAHVVKEDFMVFICHISPSLPKAKRDGNCPEL